jgi:hypothetical protein
MDLDTLKEELAALIRWVMRDVRYHINYICEVQGQDADGLLDLLCDDERLRGTGLSGVPIRVGLPGFKVKVPSGARVMLGFDDGKPNKPYAALFDPNSVTEIQFADGTQAVSRQGDLVISGGKGLVVTFLPLPPLPPTGVPPNGAVVVGVPHLISFSAIPIDPVTLLQEPLYGSVATGNPKHLA